MPVELGTLDDPEITLRIGSSDELEFVDDAGNVVGTLDQAGALSIDDIGITSLSKGSTIEILEALATDDAGFHVVAQPTDGVSTTAKTIVARQSDDGDVGAGLVMVSGGKRGSTNRFYDVVTWGRDMAAGASVIDSGSQGSADGRSYSRNSGALDLAMAANTYDVVAAGISTRRNSN